jgi:hypothetical protein
MDRKPLDLTCYVYPGWRPRIRAASSRRAWMDATPESFAYRCLPLNIANAHGWELLSPCAFEAEWTGGPAVEDVLIRRDRAAPDEVSPVALFGQGVLSFHVGGLFRTPPGFDLWVGGPPNAAKDGLAPLSGVIETDWSPYSFTMNWRFTRPGHAVRFEENEPFCFLFPIERALVEAVRPRIAPIGDDPDLKRQFEQWSASRDRFRGEMEAHPPDAPADKWQKLYYRGVDADGAPGTGNHRPKLRLAEFEGAMAIPAAKPQSLACPTLHRPVPPDPAAAKSKWLSDALERLRAMSPRPGIPRRHRIGSEAFLRDHYALNRPVLLAGEVADWPAVRRWTPDYLKAAVGHRSVQVQTARNADPDYERNMAAHSRTLAFDAFIGQIAGPGAGNDTYLTAYNSAANVQSLAMLDADLGFLDDYLSTGAEAPRGMPWIGPAGTFTPLHHDLTNNLLLQIVGRKRVLLAAPGETPKLYNDCGVYSRVGDLTAPDALARFPDLEGIRIHALVLAPGDALFIPVGWWHQVTALDFSVTLTHTNFRWPNDFHTTYPALG